MLAMYNNTKFDWRVNAPKPDKGNGSFAKVSGGAKSNAGFKGISFLCPAETAVGKTNACGVTDLYTGKMNIFYGKKDNSPNFAGTESSDKNVFLIALDINGQRVIDLTRQDIFVLSYVIVSGTLFIALSVKDGCEEFQFTTYNERTKTKTVHTFAVAQTEGTLAERTTVTTVVTENARVEKPERPFKIRCFRPSRPTYLVFVKNSDKADADAYIDNAKDKNISRDGNLIVYYDDCEDLSSNLKHYSQKEGYSAATLYTNLEAAMGDDFGAYDDDVVLLRNVCNVTNIILGAKSPIGIIKR